MSQTHPGHLEQAERLEGAAAELVEAAAHLSQAAAHFRNGVVPRAAAHILAAQGHTARAREIEECVVRAHADAAAPPSAEDTP